MHAHHLPPTLQTAEASGTGQTSSLKDSLEAFEKDALQDALKSARGNRAKAARLLSTTERIFNYRVRTLRDRLAAVQGLKAALTGCQAYMPRSLVTVATLAMATR